MRRSTRVNLRGGTWVLSQRLGEAVPAGTPDAGPEGVYRVVSLYFDDPYDTALRQKLDGVNRREKFRLRYYGEAPGFLKLEKKWKVNGLCGKRGARLTVEEGRRLLSGERTFLLERGEPLLLEFACKLTKLSPKTVVAYRREAFTFTPGNVRITLDRDIRSGGPESFFRPEDLLPAPAGGHCAGSEIQ